MIGHFDGAVSGFAGGGDYENTNYEEIVSLKPTAMVIQTDPSKISARLRETAARSILNW